MASQVLFNNKYRIQSARLANWDYAEPGYYFVTVCTKNRRSYFGVIVAGRMELTDIGQIADKYWGEIPSHFPHVRLDAYVVMPNHVHGIIVIKNNAGATRGLIETQNTVVVEAQNMVVAGAQNMVVVEAQNFAPLRRGTNGRRNVFGPQRKNLASIIRGFKIGVKKWGTQHDIDFAWQPRFYDHIIRTNQDLDRIRHYIVNNPRKWVADKNHF